MSLLVFAALVCFAVDVGAFGWGMARFFAASSTPSTSTRIVGGLGSVLAAADVWAVVRHPASPERVAGAVVVYVLALALFVWAIHSCRGAHLHAIFDVGRSPRIIRSGAFRALRHPFYIAYSAFWIAGCLASRSAVAPLAWAAMTLIYAVAAIREEATLVNLR